MNFLTIMEHSRPLQPRCCLLKYPLCYLCWQSAVSHSHLISNILSPTISTARPISRGIAEASACRDRTQPDHAYEHGGSTSSCVRLVFHREGTWVWTHLQSLVQLVWVWSYRCIHGSSTIVVLLFCRPSTLAAAARNGGHRQSCLTVELRWLTRASRFMTLFRMFVTSPWQLWWSMVLIEDCSSRPVPCDRVVLFLTSVSLSPVRLRCLFLESTAKFSGAGVTLPSSF